MPSMISRIRKGAALLDRKRKGWREEIDIDRLHLGIPSFWPGQCGCVLAQLYGEFGIGLKELGIIGEGGLGRGRGFMISPNEDSAALTRAWKRYLKA